MFLYDILSHKQTEVLNILGLSNSHPSFGYVKQGQNSNPFTQGTGWLDVQCTVMKNGTKDKWAQFGRIKEIRVYAHSEVLFFVPTVYFMLVSKYVKEECKLFR
jgi:hypothetical protein